MTTFAVYTCGNCGTVVSKNTTNCPHCHAMLTAIRCTGCGFVGSRDLFANDVCPKCGTRIVLAAPDAPAPARSARPRRPPGQKSPAAHAWASVAIPGLGSMLADRKNRGVLIFGLSAASLFGLTALLDWLTDERLTVIGSLVAIPLWIWGIVDAYQAAQVWNDAHPPIQAPPTQSPPSAAAPTEPAPQPQAPMHTDEPTTAAPPPTVGTEPSVPFGGSTPLVQKLTAELVDIGRSEGYVGSPGESFDEHWNHKRARQIGTTLDDLGGLELMRHVHAMITAEFGVSARPRELEACWGGIGRWMG